MHDVRTIPVDLDRAAAQAAAKLERAVGRTLAELCALDELDAAIARSNARLPPRARILPAHARGLDPKHVRVMWRSLMSEVQFRPPTKPIRKRAC